MTAALYLHPDGYDTTGKALLGRHSAGESFLRGYLKHARADHHLMWNVAGRPVPELEAMLARVGPPTRPVAWVERRDRHGLGRAGVLNMPVPDIPLESWQRQPYGPTRYAITGITHTTATAAVMSIIPSLLLSPLQDFDTLICTSTAVRASVETQLNEVRDYLAADYGPRRRPEPARTTIPLGVNAADFATSPEARAQWRARLDIPDDAVVALYVGRFNVRAKMNPGLMAMALERAAALTKRKICWVNSGWADTPELEAHYHQVSRDLCPSVLYRSVDGRPADVRFSIWSVGDFFISFSDNIQETFGLTPVEAMAAGLPCVVTDWDGYKDTVRHGEDGFRIPTWAPPSGSGGDFSYWFANRWIDYDSYVGGVAQYVALDYPAAAEAIRVLVDDEALRARMGASARERARDVFDWATIIPQYEALWAEQNIRRLASSATATRGNPWRPDPYLLFENYPTHHLTPENEVTLVPGMTWPKAKARLDAPLAIYSRFNRPMEGDVQTVLAYLAGRPSARVDDIVAQVAPAQRSYVQRGLLWLARHDVIIILPPR